MYVWRFRCAKLVIRDSLTLCKILKSERIFWFILLYGEMFVSDLKVIKNFILLVSSKSILVVSYSSIDSLVSNKIDNRIQYIFQFNKLSRIPTHSSTFRT